MPHVVLLGDSVFDNASYVHGGPDVVTHLRAALPAGWRATLAAVDGAVIDRVPAQLQRAPDDATHLVVSAGGNDALGHVGLLDMPARRSAEVLAKIADAREAFAARYEAMLDVVCARRLPTVLCTIYDGNLGPPTQRLASSVLAVFDDAIQRAARRRGLPVIELRDVCSDAADYANPIEPSVRGGAKIAAAIVAALGAR